MSVEVVHALFGVLFCMVWVIIGQVFSASSLREEWSCQWRDWQLQKCRCLRWPNWLIHSTCSDFNSTSILLSQLFPSHDLSSSLPGPAFLASDRCSTRIDSGNDVESGVGANLAQCEGQDPPARQAGIATAECWAIRSTCWMLVTYLIGI